MHGPRWRSLLLLLVHLRLLLVVALVLRKRGAVRGVTVRDCGMAQEKVARS